MNPYQFSLLFFGFCTFFISLLIWLKRQDKVALIYLVFSTIVSIWASFFSIMISPVQYETALLASRVLNTAALFVPVTWFHFTLVFAGDYRRNRFLLWGLYLITAAVSLFAPSLLFVRGLSSMVGFPRYTEIGPAFHLFTILFFAIVPLGFVQLSKRINRVSGSERSQLLGLTWATFFGFLGAAPTFLPCYGIMFPQYGLFLLPVYPFVMAYFMIRKNLFSEQEMAQAAHRNKLAAMGTLAASINHEIRNPLYVIQGLADSFIAIERDGLNDVEARKRAVEAFRKTAEQTRRAVDIMKKFAAFAKHDTPNQNGASRVDLAETLERTLPLLRHELELDRILLKSQLPTGIDPILADLRHVEEIFFNLIVNACQAMKAKGGEITISAAQRNGSVTVMVEDTGPGIPKDRLKHIFQPFYTTKEEGTGLGLYITKQLVEKNGGRISVESKEGRGTKVTLEFKRV